MFEVFDHTADLGLRIRAATKEELFADAGQALMSLVVEKLSAVRPLEEKRLRIQGQGVEYLLFDWLSELLYYFDQGHWVACAFEVTLTTEGLDAKVRGEPLDPDRHIPDHEVKAITYHGLTARETESGWLAEVIVDI